MENIIIAAFTVESEAYQAFSELKRDPVCKQSLILQAILVKKQNDRLEVSDVFDVRTESRIDTRTGGLIGACLGILGGPVGLLIGTGVGALAGAGAETVNLMKKQSILESVSTDIGDNTVALLMLVQETDNTVIDTKLNKYAVTITRYDAAEVEADVDDATKAQWDVVQAARAALYKAACVERTAKVAAARDRIAAEFDTLKARLGLNKAGEDNPR